MTLRLMRSTKLETSYPTAVKEIPHAFLDGTMTGIDALSGQPIQVKSVRGKLDCDAVNLHATSYSKRELNKTVNEMLKSMGPQALDALSSTRDLMDSSCFVWDDARPFELNPNACPVVENGAPLPGQVQIDEDDDDDI
jgi:hypothetical protein